MATRSELAPTSGSPRQGDRPPPDWAGAARPFGVFLAVAGLLVADVMNGRNGFVLALACLLCAGALFALRGIRWESAIALIIVVVFFIPIKRYTLPGNLPFNLEPYRIIVALVVLVWLVALLVDPRVKLRRSGLEVPIVVFLLAAVFSWTVNPSTFTAPGVATGAIKSFTFFLSFVLVFYVVVSTACSRRTVDQFVELMVLCGAIVGVLALVEYRTNFNVFNHLGSLPFLSFHDPRLDTLDYARGGRLRVYASAQHPIALAALLVMLLPLALYLTQARRRARWWWVATAAITLGALATVSRTAILMLVVELLVLLAIRPSEVVRILRLVPLAAVLVVLLAPNTVKGLYDAFFPKGGLIAQQTQLLANSRSPGARLARVGEQFHIFARHPLLGVGFGTRLDGPILDDQWLDSLVETGAIGVAALVLLFGSAFFKLGRSARARAPANAALEAALAASVLAFGIGMFTYDAFSFIQVTYVFFLALGLGCALLRLGADTAPRLAQPVR